MTFIVSFANFESVTLLFNTEKRVLRFPAVTDSGYNLKNFKIPSLAVVKKCMIMFLQKRGGGEIEIASFSSMRLNLHIFAAVSALQAKYDTFFCALKEYSTSQIVLV